MDGRLTSSIDAYAAFVRHLIGFNANVVFEQTPLGPRLNLDKSELGFEDMDEDMDIFGAHLEVRSRPWNWLDLFLRADLRRSFFSERDYQPCLWYPRYVTALGATLRFAEQWRGQAVLVMQGETIDLLANPESVLATSIEVEQPAYSFLLLFLSRRFSAGPLELEVGLNFFNPFNNRFREKIGVVRKDGNNFGGEILGRRLMVLVEMSY